MLLSTWNLKQLLVFSPQILRNPSLENCRGRLKTASASQIMRLVVEKIWEGDYRGRYFLEWLGNLHVMKVRLKDRQMLTFRALKQVLV